MATTILRRRMGAQTRSELPNRTYMTPRSKQIGVLRIISMFLVLRRNQ